MIHQLYVVRHGLAEPAGSPGLSDFDRRLTKEGMKRMGEVANGLLRLETEVDTILTSPLPRALQTAEILAEFLRPRPALQTTHALSSEQDARSIARWLGRQETPRLMIVGHNPALSELVSVLCLDSFEPLIDLGKGAVACLTAAQHSVPRYQLEWLAPARILRRLGSAQAR